MKVVVSMVAVILALACVVGLAQAVVEQPDRIRIAGDNHFPPFEFVDDRGVYRGFNVDLMQAMAIELGIEIELVPLPWSDALTALAAGEVHALQGMKHSPERQRTYVFSDPYLISSQAIFVKEHNRFVVSLDDLAGRHVAVQVGDHAHELLGARGDIILVLAENQEQAMALLIAGEVDAFVGNRLAGLYTLQKHRKTGLVKVVGEPISPADYGMAFGPSHAYMTDLFNRGLRAVKRNGTYDKIYRKWFGEIVGASAAAMKRIAYGLAGAVVVAGVVIAITFRWNRTLTVEVQRRTTALEESDRLKERILESVSAGIVAVNGRGEITQMNRMAVELLGLAGEPADHIGMDCTESGLSRFIGGQDLSHAAGYEGEHRALVGGKSAILRCRSYPLRGPEPSGLLVVLEDVTAERAAQAQMVQQDKMQSLGRLVGGICHEIRNPLCAIKTFVELIPTKFHVQAFRDELTRRVPQEVDRLNGLLTGLLEYSRPRAAQPGPCDLREAVEGVVSLMGPRLAESRVELAMGPMDGICILVDVHQFKQILINIILNAIESMPDGGRLDICAECTEDQAGLHILDTGCGIPPDDIPMVFEPFYTRKDGGTGLGLYISYQLMQENGGRIYIENRVGGGTCVSLWLNLASKEGARCQLYS